MKNKGKSEVSAGERRKTLQDDVQAFLKAGNKIQYIESGVSAQDPQGRGPQLRGNKPKAEQSAK